MVLGLGLESMPARVVLSGLASPQNQVQEGFRQARVARGGRVWAGSTSCCVWPGTVSAGGGRRLEYQAWCELPSALAGGITAAVGTWSGCCCSSLILPFVPLEEQFEKWRCCWTLWVFILCLFVPLCECLSVVGVGALSCVGGSCCWLGLYRVGVNAQVVLVSQC